MKNRLFLIIICISMILLICSCGSQENQAQESSKNTLNQTNQSKNTTESSLDITDQAAHNNSDSEAESGSNKTGLVLSAEGVNIKILDNKKAIFSLTFNDLPDTVDITEDNSTYGWGIFVSDGKDFYEVTTSNWIGNTDENIEYKTIVIADDPSFQDLLVKVTPTGDGDSFNTISECEMKKEGNTLIWVAELPEESFGFNEVKYIGNQFWYSHMSGTEIYEKANGGSFIKRDFLSSDLLSILEQQGEQNDSATRPDNLNQFLFNKVSNFELIDCIGKTQEEIMTLYGPVVSGNETSGYTHKTFPETAYVGYIYSEEDKALICFCVGISVGGLISDFDKMEIDRCIWGENAQDEEGPYVIFSLKDGLFGYLTQSDERYIQADDDIYIRE